MKKIGCLLAMLLCLASHLYAITINKVGGWLESAYVEFSLDSQYDGYNVYVKGGHYSSYTKLDNALVRKYSGYGRADALGLNAASGYTFKVVPTKGGAEQTSAAVESSAVTVKAHDRSGFAFHGTQMPGAYNKDGTLKSNAVVIYVTNDNKNTLKASIIYSSKGAYQSCTGILAVLTALEKGYETRPIDIRIIGCITADDQVLTPLSSSSSTSTLAAAKDFKGDWMFSSNKKDCKGITVEGVGNDAVANGWGIRFKGLNYGECRNIGFMNCHSDEGDNVGLQQDDNYCWVHNCDMFYGDAGSDADQVKGDGALDCKKSNYITFSFNHFWDNGKCNLLGLSEGVNSYSSSPYYITYHHNWYDHSDSRHPRCRYYNAHVYNNYYDGNSKYGAGSCLYSSVFMEGNYFRNCKYPMLISMQGSDPGIFSSEDGGMIKAYNNSISGGTFKPYSSTNTTEFDAYVVTNKSTTVPSTVTAKKGGAYYSNFDTNSSVMYSYTAEEPSDAMATVTGSFGAGRMQHGDFSWTFSDSKDDESHDVDTNLKAALASYTTTLVGLFSDDTSSGGGSSEGDDPVAASDDATLKTLTVKGYSISFNASTTTYSVTLPAGTTTVPTVTATPTNSSAKAVVTAGTISNSKATTTVVVTAADGTTTETYTINFTVSESSDVPTTGSTIDAAKTFNFSETAYTSYFTGTMSTSTSKGNATYNNVTNSTCIKMESSTAINFTTAMAFDMVMVFGSAETGSAKVDGTEYKASAANTPITVSIAAGAHTISKSVSCNLYFLDFTAHEEETPVTPTESSDATLSALSMAGYELSPAFSADTHTYSVKLKAGSTSVPAITATANDSKAKVTVDLEECTPAGQADIVVTAEDGTEESYFINISVATITPVVSQTEELAFPYNGTFFTVSGNTSDTKGSVTYNGKTYTTCLKMESSTKVSFTTTAEASLTLVMGAKSQTIKVDDTSYTAGTDGIITIESLSAGTHTITKVGTDYLYYGLLSISAGYTIGDVNQDGLINIADVAALIAYLNGKTPANFSEKAADVDGIGTVDVKDVEALAELVKK